MLGKFDLVDTEIDKKIDELIELDKKNQDDSDHDEIQEQIASLLDDKKNKSATKRFFDLIEKYNYFDVDQYPDDASIDLVTDHLYDEEDLAKEQSIEDEDKKKDLRISRINDAVSGECDASMYRAMDHPIMMWCFGLPTHKNWGFFSLEYRQRVFDMFGINYDPEEKKFNFKDIIPKFNCLLKRCITIQEVEIFETRGVEWGREWVQINETYLKETS